MIYFIFNGSYCSAEEINEQMAEKVQYITKDEYDAYMEEHFPSEQEENSISIEMP